MKMVRFLLLPLVLTQAATAATVVDLKKGEAAVVCESDRNTLSSAVSKLNKRLAYDQILMGDMDDRTAPNQINVNKPFSASAPVISVEDASGFKTNTVCVTLTKQ